MNNTTYEKMCHDYTRETIEKFQNCANVQLSKDQFDQVYALILNAMLKAKDLLMTEN